MTSIPEDLYYQVFELSTDLTDAAESGDDDEYALLLAELQALHRERATLGLSHPFLTETLADYTEDLEQSAALFLLAIEEAAGFADESTYTKHISLAEVLFSIGRNDEARQHLELGLKLATEAGDQDWIDDAAELARSSLT
jgi:hypothetical protein